MKTKLIFVVAAMFAIAAGSVQKANAQAWTLTGNNNATNTSKLGTLNPFPLRLYANGNQWMHIETDGRVGIGTLTPASRFVINSNTGQDAFRVMINNNTRFLVNEKGGASIGSTTEGPDQGLYVFGNVGIGQAVPLVKLHINGGTNAGLSSGGYAVIGSVTSQNVALDVNGIMSRVNGAASALYLNEYGGNVYIDRNNTGSRLGIGTTTPGAKLHINSTLAGREVARFDGANQAFISIYENGVNRGYFGTYSGNTEDVDLGTPSISSGKVHLTIKTSPALTVDVNKNVGIGTTVPAAKLHVANGADAEPNSGGFVVVGDNVEGLNIAIDNNEIMARNGATADGTGTLNLNNDGGNVIIDGTNTGSRVGIGISAPAYQLQLSTNSAAKPTSSFWSVASDQRLKKNVAEFTDGLNIITKIHPVWYNYNGEAGIDASERSVGTIAQELQKVAPYMIKEWAYQKEDKSAKTNYLSVDYNAMLFMFVNAFKEQQQQIDAFKERIAKLEAETAVNNSGTGIAATSKPATVDAALEQNSPNPFSSVTTIRYRIPSSVIKAQIMVTNIAGNTVKTFTLNGKGAGAVTINAGELAAGSYYYSLIADGKKIDSKQMVLIK